MRCLRRLALLAGLAGQAALAEGVTVDFGMTTRDWLNSVRAAEGRASLILSDQLTRAAAAHASDMARTGRFSHAGRDGSTVAERVRRQDYSYCFVAENIARGQATPQEVLDDWMASPGHRRNMLDPRATGVALVRGPGRVWVMVLGRDGC